MPVALPVMGRHNVDAKKEANKRRRIAKRAKQLQIKSTSRLVGTITNLKYSHTPSLRRLRVGVPQPQAHGNGHDTGTTSSAGPRLVTLADTETEINDSSSSICSTNHSKPPFVDSPVLVAVVCSGNKHTARRYPPKTASLNFDSLSGASTSAIASTSRQLSLSAKRKAQFESDWLITGLKAFAFHKRSLERLKISRSLSLRLVKLNWHVYSNAVRLTAQTGYLVQGIALL